MIVLSQLWFILMAAVPALYWLLPERLRAPWLAASTAAFVGFYSPLSLAILGVFTGGLYAAAGSRAAISGKRLAAIVAGLALTLCAFKTHAALDPAYTLDPAEAGSFLIPLGLSYYTLRCIHYAIEKYKGALPPHGHAAFVQYMFFLPAIVAGPIHRFPAFVNDLQRRRFDPYMFGEGLQRILYGAVKISFIANFLIGFQLETIIMALEIPAPALSKYLAMAQMGLDLYFKFAGYSDIAIGFALLLGFKIMENFDRPWLARNISDLWSRWHISLTSWCRDYIYMGVIALTRKPAAATLAAMVTLGLWHEFSLRYLLWGFYNGAGIVAWQRFQKAGLPMPAWLANILTLHYFAAGLVLVRHDTIGEALTHLRQVFLFFL